MKHWQTKRSKNMQYSRLIKEAKNAIGVSPMKLTKTQMAIVLHIRLFKLVQSGVISLRQAQRKIRKFEDVGGLEGLLPIFQERVNTQSMKMSGRVAIRKDV